MNDTTLVFIEACTECGRVQRVYAKGRPRRKRPVLCAECSALRRRGASPRQQRGGSV